MHWYVLINSIRKTGNGYQLQPKKLFADYLSDFALACNSLLLIPLPFDGSWL